jgi:hypothetical protein
METIFIVSLAKISTGMAWYRLIRGWFGGNPDYWCYAFGWFIDYIFVTFYHKISGNSMMLWVNQIDEMRKSIWEKMKTAPCQVERFFEGSTNEMDIIDIEFEVFRLFGFLDDTCTYMNRPGAGPADAREHAPRRIGAHDIQRAFFTGYLRKHGLKFQHLLLPNGMYGSVWGSSIAHNDTGILNISGLVDYLQDILSWIPGTRIYPALYADGIFPRTPVIVGREVNGDDNQMKIVRRCNTLRQSIELCYGAIFNQNGIFRNATQFKLLKSGEKAYRLCLIVFF